MAVKINTTKKTVAKAIIKLAAAVLVFSFVILGGGSTIFGWFLQNRTTNAGTNANVIDDDVVAEYFAYKYDYNNNGDDVTISNTYTVDSLVMNPYDKVFIKRNEYTPVVVRISLTGEKNLPKSGVVNIKIDRDSAINESAIDRFSSVVKFACVKGADIYSTNPETIFNNASAKILGSNNKDYFKQAAVGDDVKAFFHYDGDTLKKYDYLTFPIEYTESDFNGDTLNIYLYFDYDKTMIERFIQSAIGEDLSLTETSVSAEDDLAIISAKPVR